MGADYNPSNRWRVQDNIRLNQAAPIQNQWYIVVPFTGVYTWVKYICCAIQTANETVEIEVTIDGVVHTGLAALVAGNLNTVYFSDTPAGATTFYIFANTRVSLDLQGHDVQIRIRKTTALGAGNLQCKAVIALV